MTLYHDLASAKDDLRHAKDHEQTMRAIAESGVATTGKNADDRKRELTIGLNQNMLYRKALNDLRRAELAVDEAQAAIDQAETERRDREWAIRARLTAALERHHIADEDAAPDWLQDRRMQHRAVGLAQARREMDELFQK